MAYTAVQISDKIRKITAAHLGVDTDEITPKAHFVDDLGADSLDHGRTGYGV